MIQSRLYTIFRNISQGVRGFFCFFVLGNSFQILHFKQKNKNIARLLWDLLSKNCTKSRRYFKELPIWQRYFYKQFLSTIVFILLALLGLFVAIDLMAHLKYVAKGSTSFFTWIEYYLCSFSKKLDVFIPFAILLATIRTLTSFQQKGELIAMFVSGIPRKKLLQPYLVVAALFSSLLFLNYQWGLPQAIPHLNSILETSFGKNIIEVAYDQPKEIMLEDASKIIYTTYSRKNHELRDVYWIKSIDEIFHMKTLSIDTPKPEATFVTKIERMKDNALEKKETFKKYTFSDLQFNKEVMKTSILPPKELSLTQLLSQLFLYSSSSSFRASELRATLYSKLLFPLICIFAFFGPAPFCIRFRRGGAILPIYLLSIAAFFIFCVLQEAAFTIAKVELLMPAFAISLPWLLVTYLFGKRYASL